MTLCGADQAVQAQTQIGEGWTGHNRLSCLCRLCRGCDEKGDMSHLVDGRQTVTCRAAGGRQTLREREKEEGCRCSSGEGRTRTGRQAKSPAPGSAQVLSERGVEGNEAGRRRQPLICFFPLLAQEEKAVANENLQAAASFCAGVRKRCAGTPPAALWVAGSGVDFAMESTTTQYAIGRVPRCLHARCRVATRTLIISACASFTYLGMYQVWGFTVHMYPSNRCARSGSGVLHVGPGRELPVCAAEISR